MYMVVFKDFNSTHKTIQLSLEASLGYGWIKRAFCRKRWKKETQKNSYRYYVEQVMVIIQVIQNKMVTLINSETYDWFSVTHK